MRVICIKGQGATAVCEACENREDAIEGHKSLRARRKLWTVCRSLHCAIVGTCLTVSDVRSLLQRARLKLPDGVTDYEIHGLAVKACSDQDCAPGLAKLMNKTLDRKYAGLIRRAKGFGTDAELEAFWQDHADTAHVAGAFWTILTHPMTTEGLSQRVYGDIHMMSHLQGSAHRDDRKRLSQQDQELAEMRIKLKETRGRLDLANRQNDRDRQKIDDLSIQLKATQEGLQKAQRNLQLWQSGDMVADLEAQIEDLMRALTKQTNRAAALESDLITTKNSLRAQTPATAPSVSADAKPLPLASHLFPASDLTSSNADADQMSVPSRAPMHAPHPRRAIGGGQADHLTGRAILYVGGRQNLLPHYRKAVQEVGGRFEHHDGGVECSMERLGSSLSQVDCVVCPIDCVSHNACQKIKDMCRKLGTEIRFLRAASVSALTEELETLDFTEERN